MFRKFIEKILVSRWLGPVAALVGVLLVSPSLNLGWFADDFYTRWILTQSPAYSDVRPAQSDIFRFFDGDPHRNQRMKDIGMLPWWVSTGFKISFWKPLTTLTHIIDYKFWPERPDIMHAQNLLWFGLLLLGASLLYRRIMGGSVAAGISIVLFAIDYSHTFPAIWLANRNAVMAAFFGILAIYAHHQWRRHGSRMGIALGPVLLMMCLLSAEAGIGAMGYILAYTLVLDRGTWWRRLAAVLPYIIVVLIWRIMWSWQGYGVSDDMIDFYLDPMAHPLRFIEMIFLRAPILLLGQLAFPPAEVHGLFGPYGVLLHCLIGVAFLSILAIVLLPLLRRSAEARFWALGMLLATIPICSTLPINRQLLFVGIGAMGLLGQYLALALSGELWQGKSLVRRLPQAALIGVLVLIHIIFAPLGMLVVAKRASAPGHTIASLKAIPGMSAADCDRDLIIVNHPVPPVSVFGPLTFDGQSLPRSLRVLAGSSSALGVQRLDERSLILCPKSGYFCNMASRIFYDMEHPLKQGETIELSNVSITVLELTEDGRPAKVLFRFHVALEDPSLKWVYWEEGKFKEFQPPGIGESIEIPAFKSFL
ncbi:MAG: hypothetical protein ABSA16_07355 [Thermoguttaceae bacterium]|jgi:hypothetical protein